MDKATVIAKLMDIQELCNEALTTTDHNNPWSTAKPLAKKILDIIKAQS
ncbi:hypothetical protein SEA_COMMAND613_61 [Mycobacterium phage Command613]|nr:hypothetical protein SEA_COMMAND613_61 [Mycobacterium phage Command613]